MIQLDEKIIGVWYIPIVQNYSDWMAGIREIEADKKYELVYRFRYYTDGDGPFNDDKKNWYKGELSGTRNYVLLSMRSVAQGLIDGGASGPMYEVLSNGDLKDFTRRFQEQPFVFARMMGKETTA